MRRWLISVVALLALACAGGPNRSGAGSTTDEFPTGPGAVGPGEFAFLVGTWIGTWTDTRFNVTGTLEATMTVSGNDVQANGTIGLQSLGLGEEDGTGTGSIDGNTLVFTFEADTVGNGNGSVTEGEGSGMGTVLGALNFGDFTFEGTVNETTIDGTFEFTAPSGGRGTATLTKQ